MDAETLLLAQLVLSGAMTGLIWFVQVVHYPLYTSVGETFAAYHARHVRRTTAVVGVIMPMELVTAAGLWWMLEGRAEQQTLALVALLMLLGVWLSTATLQIPAHHLLEKRYSPAVASWLVRSNWIRTILWTARLGLLVYLAGSLFRIGEP